MSIDLGNNRLSVGNQLVRAAWRYPHKEAIVCKGKRVTFKELNNRANSLAHGLMDLGIRKGDFVAIILMNCVEFVETYFALAKIGAIAAPQNYRLTPNDIERLINQCEAKALVYGGEFKDLVASLRTKLKSVKNYIYVGEGEVEDTIPYEELATGHSTEEPKVDILQDDGQYMNYTSGTTGLPKASIMTHYNNLMAVSQVATEVGIDSSWVIMTVFPLFHRVGWVTVLAGVTSGCKNVITEIDPKSILENIEKEKVNFVNFVPVITNLLMMVPNFDKYDMSSLKTIVYAAAPLTTEVREATQKYFTKNIAEYYGNTESSVLVYCNPEMKKTHPTSLGTPAFGVELRLVDENDKDVPVGEIGEIIARSPAMNANYFKNPEKTKEAMRSGWFHMGDLGRFDEDRHLYIVGRVEDLIISGADKIFAPEVEDLIQSHPKVEQCAVIGLPDKTLGKVVTAIITLKAGEQIDEQEIIDYLRGKIADFKIPKKVRIIDAIPRTATGKVLKYQLVQKYSE
ncbi:MAG: class I adenylate-forming enzyme family protein [Candidatus Jordarchaeum sp.]|uniref:class I adenylate-forming enzyme family protein n=1 Tax=Candidatus Jordarchaeum sp. TaxID=2823881 RepID=UPI00404AF1CD